MWYHQDPVKFIILLTMYVLPEHPGVILKTPSDIGIYTLSKSTFIQVSACPMMTTLKLA